MSGLQTRMLKEWGLNMKQIRNIAVAMLLASGAHAGSTVIVSSTVYANMSQAKTNVVPVSLPKPGLYTFDIVVDSTGSVAFSSLAYYLQQEGLSGQFYTVYNSSFTSCSAACAQALFPDMYLGGRVRAQYSMTSGSATVKITAREVNP
jgi:hypothetical protein